VSVLFSPKKELTPLTTINQLESLRHTGLDSLASGLV
jgi:hypothetical protein